MSTLDQLSEKDLIEKAEALGNPHGGSKALPKLRIREEVRRERSPEEDEDRSDFADEDSRSGSGGGAEPSSLPLAVRTKHRGRSRKAQTKKKQRRRRRRSPSGSSSSSSVSSCSSFSTPLKGRKNKRKLSLKVKDDLMKHAESLIASAKGIEERLKLLELSNSRKSGAARKPLRTTDRRLSDIRVADAHSWEVADELRGRRNFGGSRKFQKNVERATSL